MEKNICQITIEELKNILFDRCKKKARVILAIAGPPASGKSTLAKNISEYFNLKQKYINGNKEEIRKIEIYLIILIYIN